MSSIAPRPFQVLLIDDRADLSALSGNLPAGPNTGASCNPLIALNELRADLSKSGKAPNWEVRVSKSVGLQPNEVSTVLSSGITPNLNTDVDVRTFLASLDVLILDLGETGEFRGARTLKAEKVLRNLRKVRPDVNQIGTEDLKSITDSAKESGVGFYYQYSENLAHCQAVFVLTVHDGETTPTSIKNLLDPFCGAENYAPYTAKFDKGNADDIKQMVARIGVLYELHQKGYTLGDKLAEIEFAAHHDLPVMICGESGTGKEYIARHIHQRWALRMIQEKKLDEKAIDRIVSVNCAVLSAELGSAELFGHTPDAFTGATDFNLGKILGGGCGINLEARQDKAGKADLAGRTSKRLAGEDPNFDVKRITVKDAHPEASTAPMGTLFLDEFGDLDPTIQARLLRYLQSWEVQMVGLPGVIKGARLRIIAATSDPRFAAFAGYIDEGGDKMRLRGQWRSATELALPLRSDLLFRVKGQTIRATPITTGGKWKDAKGKEHTEPANVTHTVERLIESLRKTDWEKSAQKKLVEVIEEQIKRVMEAENTPEHERALKFSGGLPVFGHRREIVRFIELADAYVSTHQATGGRKLSHDQVTSDVIEWLWKPSSIYALPISDSATELDPHPAEIQKIHEKLTAKWQEITGNVVPDTWSKRATSALSKAQKSKFDAVIREYSSIRRNGADAWKKQAVENYFSGLEIATVVGWFAAE